jgi:hypothetical protein
MQTLGNIIRGISSYFKEKEIPYAIVGGATLPLLGMPRSTFDVDVIAMLDEKDVGDFVEYIKSKGFLTSSEDIKNALREKSHCTIDYKEPPYRIDLKGAYGPGEKNTLEHSEEKEYLGFKVMIQSPEDAIANKLRFGSEQDIKDAMTIYVRQVKELDKKYLEEICSKLGVLDKLREIKEKSKGI